MALKDLVDRFMASAFRGTGHFIGTYPYFTIIAMLTLTAILSSGLIFLEEVNNVRTEYSPLNSPSRREYEVAKAFLNQNGTLDPSYMMVEARDGGNLLRDDYRDLLIEFVKSIYNNVSVEYQDEEWDFRRMCEPYCELNTAFLAFLKLYDRTKEITTTYPAIEIFGTKAFIGNNVYGVTLNGTNVEAFTTAILPLYLVAPYGKRDVILAWQNAAKEILFNDPRFERFKCGLTSDSLVSFEVRRMGMETAPLMAGSVTAMIIFVIFSSFRQDPSRAKTLESSIGCLIPLLAMLASLGLLCFCGMKFQSIIVASLFLVLSVGVDDIFIIIRAWDRSQGSVPERMAFTLEEAGPSITISSITNAAAFLIGMTSATPAVRTFSLFSSVSVMVCFFYILTIFSALIALSGRRERAGRQAILCCLQADPRARCRVAEYAGRVQTVIITFWSRAATWWSTRLILVFVLAVYYYISVLGIIQLHSFISVEKMALPDSYLQNFQEHYENALRNMQPISVFILNPGDLRDQERFDTITQIVHDFENAVHSYGPESTFFWLETYKEFLAFYGESEDFTYTEVPTFFKSATYFYLSSFVRYNESACLADDPACITSFFFLTNFHDMIKYHELIPLLQDWRRIAAKYPDYQVYPYSDHAPFVDQTMSIDSTVWSSVATALACTALACFIFIPSLACIVVAVLSVFSITIGVIGILSLWGLDLDPLTMAALLMAIGFSVDSTAHICYHYYKAKQAAVVDRLENCLSSIGGPLIQVGISTIVALAPLLFKQSYLALVFLKTITVVVILGMIHGLIIVPVALALITSDRISKSPSTGSSDASERSSQRSAERKESFYRTQRLIKGLHQEFKHKKVAPVLPEDTKNRPAAFKHNIALGRTLSAEQ